MESCKCEGANHELRRLDNGMTILCERLPYLRSAAAGLWIKTGSANESAAHSGISHLLEHLFFKGTSTRSTRELMEAIEGRGGHLNAFTARDYTCLYAKTLDTQVDTSITILGDILCDSQFFDFEKERNVVVEEIVADEDVPEEYVHDLLFADMFPNHSLGRPITGSVDSVSNLTIEDVRAYYNAWYRPENIVFSIAGNFEEERVFDLANKAFAPLKHSDLPAGELCGAPGLGSGTRVVERDIAQSHLCFAFPGPTSVDPRRIIHDTLCNVLGGGSTSRLFEKIREDEGLSYSIYAFQSCYLRSGLLGVYAAVAPENLAKTIELAFDEIRDLRDSPISAEELDLNREQLKGGLLMSLESTFNRMARQAKSVIYHDRVVPVDELVARIDAVTVESIHESARESFRAEDCALVVLGPDDGATPREVPL